jgi:hypothetical protein
MPYRHRGARTFVGNHQMVDVPLGFRLMVPVPDEWLTSWSISGRDLRLRFVLPHPSTTVVLRPGA